MPPNQREAKIPNTIDRAFYGCSSLTDIQFKGTVEEWKAIQKKYLLYLGSENYTVTCTDGTIDKEGNVTYFEQ